MAHALHAAGSRPPAQTAASCGTCRGPQQGTPVKRIALYASGLLVVPAAAVVLASRLSPWPGALLVRYLFARGDARTSAQLARHVPSGITARCGLRYGPGHNEQLDLYRRADAPAGQPTVVWVHGGGWVGGQRQAVANYLQVLAGHGCTTVALGYATASRAASYPTPVRQVNAALEYLRLHAAGLGIDPERMILAGSSAGAQISAQVGLLATDPVYARELGIPPTVASTRLRGLMLLSGAFDIQGVGDNWFVNSLLWAYTGKRHFRTDARLQLMAITPHVGRRFPPSFIASGNGDPLQSQARALAARLRLLGVEHQSQFHRADVQPPLPHEYQFDLDRPQGRQTLELMLGFIARHAGNPAASATTTP